MRLKTTTDWPAYFLRRMVSWCAKQIELPGKALRLAEFGNRTTCAWSGRGGSGRVLVRVGPASKFPLEPYKSPGYPGLTPRLADRVEALVALTAHELTHVREMHKRVSKPCNERQTMYETRRVHAMFVASKEALLAEWSKAPAERAAKPKATIAEKRAAKVLNDLSRWQRKLKLAQTKVKKLRVKVRYYERSAAARPATP